MLLLFPSTSCSSSATSSLPLLRRRPNGERSWRRRRRRTGMLQNLSRSSASDVRSSNEEAARDNHNNHQQPSFPSIRSPKRVVLVRHGQSTWNEEGRIQGSSDHSVLTPKGESQAEISRQMLLHDSFDACFTSSLVRAKTTAEIIWSSDSSSPARRGLPLIPDPDLREIDLYAFQGLLNSEAKAGLGESYLQWQNDAPNFCIDGHYPVRELWDRAGGCWDKILAHPANSVLVVAHNAIIQALVATALGLGTHYFRLLLQSNCGVSVLDFNPTPEGGSPHVCLNRLNQTPGSPVGIGASGGRKTKKRVILVCHGATAEVTFPNSGFESLNMLGIIQSQKTAELLLDVKLSSIICSPRITSVDTATAISEVQEAADCLGADCIARNVEVKKMLDLEVERIFQGRKIVDLGGLRWLSGLNDKDATDLWNQTKNVWQSLKLELSDDQDSERNIVVVAHPVAHIALIAHCLKLKMEYMESLHLDHGSISVLDFPDGPTGQGVVRCVNYTAHLGRWSIPVTRPTVDDKGF